MPPLVADLISHIERNGLDSGNLYRRQSDITSRLNYSSMFETLLDSGPQSFDPRSASLLARKMLKIVGEPFIDMETQAVLCRTIDAWDCGAVNDLVSSVRQSISTSTVNRCYKDTLALVCCHLCHVHMANRCTKPDSLAQLVECFTGVLRIKEKILKFIITNADELFGKIDLNLTLDRIQAAGDSYSMPDSAQIDVSFYRAELDRKESLLAILIAEANQDGNVHKDEMLWTLQREITQIKRKLKRARSSSSPVKGDSADVQRSHQVVGDPGRVDSGGRGEDDCAVASKSVLLGEHMLSGLRAVREEIAAELQSIRSCEMAFERCHNPLPVPSEAESIEELSTRLAKLLVGNEALECQLDQVKRQIEREQMAIDQCTVELKWRCYISQAPDKQDSAIF